MAGPLPRATAMPLPGPPSPADSQRALARIRLRHLQCFLAIAELRSLRRAAEALAVTQPAVTKTLNELEALLGARLVVRGRKGATLTPEAESFLRHASTSVNALSQAVDSVVGGPGEQAVRLGVLPTVGPFCAEVFETLRARRPLAALHVVGGRNAQLVEALRARTLDAVIGRLAEADVMAGLSFEPLYAEPMLIALAPDHALARKRRPVPADIAAQPLILPVPGTLIRQVADSYLAGHGIVAQAGIVETLDTGLARALARRGPYLWFTPAGAASDDLAAGALARLPPSLTPEEPVGLILRTDLLPPPPLAALLAAVREAAAARRQAAG